jgi:very-short-patch-repair endonuclease
MVVSELESEFLACWHLMCRANGIDSVDPVREYVFAPPRRWRFDFAWVKQRVAVEIEGGLWMRGRHTTAKGMLADMDKYNAAAALGWFVLRFAAEHLRGDPQGVFEAIVACMNCYRIAARAAGGGDATA